MALFSCVIKIFCCIQRAKKQLAHKQESENFCAMPFSSAGLRGAQKQQNNLLTSPIRFLAAISFMRQVTLKQSLGLIATKL